MYYLIMYDIHNPKRLVKIAKLMLNYGSRVQYSVFEAEMYESQLREMVSLANKIMNKYEDSLKIFSFCEKCSSKRIAFGKTHIKNENPPFQII